MVDRIEKSQENHWKPNIKGDYKEALCETHSWPMFDPTLNGLIAQIENKKIVLPAMQRPFVWREDRITKLIDSLLRGFPIGTALIWKTSIMQRFRPFQKDIQADAGITIDFEAGGSKERYLVLDGQQRLTSLYVALVGTYDNKKLFIDVLSGYRGDKDPGNTYWDSRFLTEKEAQDLNRWPKKSGPKFLDAERHVFVKLQDLTRLQPARAGLIATQASKELELTSDQSEQMTKNYLEGATILASTKALQIHLIDEDAGEEKPIDEILEIFVRVNSAGLVLQKSDLMMSLLDLEWNDIQPELYRAVAEVNKSRPFNITRDDLLKSLLLANGSETRFDRLVADRLRLKKLASELPRHLPEIQTAWKSLTIILIDDCKISSERFFRGGHNTLLPFVLYLYLNPNPRSSEKRRLVTAIYVALMSTVFAGAEARMGKFARRACEKGKPYPLEAQCRMIARQWGAPSLDTMLGWHPDLALNIAHGGISLDNNPENLQRDHIFPRSTLEAKKVPPEKANHYANLHFLRDKDNLNKSNIPPHQWFQKPGDQSAYSIADLEERLLSYELLQPGQFAAMLKDRSEKIRQRALTLFKLESAEAFDALFADADDNRE